MASVVEEQVYTFDEVFALAKFDWKEAAAVDYNDDGFDARRVKVAGLGFDSPEESFRVSVDSKAVEIAVDGEVVATLNVVKKA